VRATDHQRFEHSADDVQRLVRCARSRLFLSVVTALILVVLLAYATPPDATVFEIYIAAEGDDASPGEALPPTSVAPLRVRNAGTPLLGDCWSARVARTLMTVRGRAPPGKNATGRITIPAPPSVPVETSALLISDVTEDGRGDWGNYHQKNPVVYRGRGVYSDDILTDYGVSVPGCHRTAATTHALDLSTDARVLMDRQNDDGSR